MKYIFLGSGLIAEKCLQQLLYSETIIGIPSGIVSNAENLKLFEENKSISKILLNMLDKNEEQVMGLISEISPDFIISVQYPWILSSTVLDMVPGRAFNIHNAKLPEYRGHNALTYEILNGDKTHTSSLHLMDKVVDRGRLIKTEEIEISSNETAFSLWERSITSCVKLFRWLVLEKNYLLADQHAKPINGVGCYYGKHQIKVDKQVPFSNDIQTLYRYARAFYFPPHEPAYLLSGNTKIYLTPESNVNRLNKN
jgi:methionyl-tRNA formyltransferase